MTIEYVVLGAILIVMGAAQAWLRHGPEGRKLRAEQDELVQRRMQNVAPGAEYDAAARAAKRSGKAWSSWTAVLGPVCVVFGIALIVLGLLGY
jgi:hypothetical protein